MKVYLRTDMLALTTPLERYLSDEFGLDTEDPELWDVYASGLDELYREMPYVEGCCCASARAARSTTSPAGTTTPSSRSPR